LAIRKDLKDKKEQTMIKRTLRYFAAVTLSLWLAVPAPVLAAVNPDAQSAAAAGLKYLNDNQNADGSISGFGGESEWSVEAVQAAGQQASTFAHGGSSLLDFLKTDAPGPGTVPTTLERKIIAISAAGQDPSSFGGVDYESLLSAQHLSGQIGDPTLLNDDIFGIIAIDAAHDSSLLPEAQDALDYLTAHQGADGGFSYTTASCAWCGADSSDTAAAIVAMYAASDLGLGSPSLDAARSAALNYLLGTQQADGGFGGDASSPSDGSSTAWALIALNTIGSASASSAASARDWLLNDQNPDGGFSYGAFGVTDSDTYTTAGAVTALLGTTWLLRPVPISIATGTGGGTSTKQPNLPVPAAAQVTPQSSQPSQAPEQPAAPPPAASADPSGADTDTTGQVKGASTAKPSRKNTVRPVATQADKRSYSIYFLAFLGSIAIMWFVLESRKTQGDNT
jgi:prenyltransferase/squalene oxidase-like repeat protein